MQINAETTAGGIAHWITSEVAGTLRTNASDWTAAYQPYIGGIIDTVVPNQVTEGGPILCMYLSHIAAKLLIYNDAASISVVQVGEGPDLRLARPKRN